MQQQQEKMFRETIDFKILCLTFPKNNPNLIDPEERRAWMQAM